MAWIFFAICGLVILLGYEIRYRVMTEELAMLKTDIKLMEEEILRLSAEMKLK